MYCHRGTGQNHKICIGKDVWRSSSIKNRSNFGSSCSGPCLTDLNLCSKIYCKLRLENCISLTQELGRVSQPNTDLDQTEGKHKISLEQALCMEFPFQIPVRYDHKSFSPVKQHAGKTLNEIKLHRTACKMKFRIIIAATSSGFRGTKLGLQFRNCKIQ